MTNQSLKDVQGFFHVNVNCTNFARSLSFYRLVGFEKFLDFDEQVPGFGPGTGGNRRNNFNRGLGGNRGALLMALQNRGPQFHKVVGDGQG